MLKSWHYQITLTNHDACGLFSSKWNAPHLPSLGFFYNCQAHLRCHATCKLGQLRSGLLNLVLLGLLIVRLGFCLGQLLVAMSFHGGICLSLGLKLLNHVKDQALRLPTHTSDAMRDASKDRLVGTSSPAAWWSSQPPVLGLLMVKQHLKRSICAKAWLVSSNNAEHRCVGR